ncbi:MAG: NAD(+) diphosphatase [Lachnospiraceae bacterium]
MIQDIAPHRFDNAYRPHPPTADCYALYYEEHQVLMERTEDSINYPRFRDLEQANPDIYEHYTYLFSIDEQSFFLADHITCPSPSRYTMENTQLFRTAGPRHLAFAGITGHQLFLWYRDHRYCGRCGGVFGKDSKERMLSCTACGYMEYPRISPAVIIGITNGSRLLLSKYAGRDYTRYALLAGFTEIGETLEETVIREALEESGLNVSNVRYYKSQPWSFSGTLLAGFFCDLDGDDTITLDEEELALAEWFEREDLPEDDVSLSLTYEMIQAFKDGIIPTEQPDP